MFGLSPTNLVRLSDFYFFLELELDLFKPPPLSSEIDLDGALLISSDASFLPRCSDYLRLGGDLLFLCFKLPSDFRTFLSLLAPS